MTSDGVAAQAPVESLALLRSRNYLRLLIIAALLGVPISIAAYFFLQLIAHIQDWVYNDLPGGLGFADQPAWWPLVPLTVAGLLVGLIPAVPTRRRRGETGGGIQTRRSCRA